MGPPFLREYDTFVQGIHGTGDLVVGKCSEVTGTESGGIAGNDRRSFISKVTSEVLGGLQSYVSVIIDVRSGREERSVIKRLRTDRGDDDVNIADPDPGSFTQLCGKTEKVGGSVQEISVRECNDLCILDL